MAIKNQLYQSLRKELKDALSLYRPVKGNLEAFIVKSKNLDNSVRAENEEGKATGKQARFWAFQLSSQILRQGTPAVGTLAATSITTKKQAPAAWPAWNSPGYYWPAPVNLSARR